LQRGSPSYLGEIEQAAGHILVGPLQDGAIQAAHAFSSPLITRSSLDIRRLRALVREAGRDHKR